MSLPRRSVQIREIWCDWPTEHKNLDSEAKWWGWREKVERWWRTGRKRRGKECLSHCKRAESRQCILSDGTATGISLGMQYLLYVWLCVIAWDTLSVLSLMSQRMERITVASLQSSTKVKQSSWFCHSEANFGHKLAAITRRSNITVVLWFVIPSWF